MSEQSTRTSFAVGSSRIGGGAPLVLFCGPCVIESRDHALRTAESIAGIAARTGFPLVFKSSYDKANRTSLTGFRGLGIEEGLNVLSEVRSSLGLPVITDVHSPEDVRMAAEVVDVLQVPAFLCRQTDLLVAAGAAGKPVLVKKGQFLHPDDMRYAAEKISSTGNRQVLLCERGTCFGYRELVVDFRAFALLRATGLPVVFDATHSVQQMGGGGGKSSGNRGYVPLLVRAAVAAGIDGLFLEAHPNPDRAPSDGPNMLDLSALESLLNDVKLLENAPLQTR